MALKVRERTKPLLPFIWVCGSKEITYLLLDPTRCLGCLSNTEETGGTLPSRFLSPQPNRKNKWGHLLELNAHNLREMCRGELEWIQAWCWAMCVEFRNELSSHPESLSVSTHSRKMLTIQWSTVWNKKTLGTNLNSHQKEKLNHDVFTHEIF